MAVLLGLPTRASPNAANECEMEDTDELTAWVIADVAWGFKAHIRAA